MSEENGNKRQKGKSKIKKREIPVRYKLLSTLANLIESSAYSFFILNKLITDMITEISLFKLWTFWF